VIDEEDDRILAWHKIAAHPFFEKAYQHEAPLIECMLNELDRLEEPDEPTEWRVLRAFSNGYAEGLRRGYEKGLDR
jgi:hypothetical protein